MIGAGILGLAVARELLLRDGRRRLVVLEKEGAIAQHQTGRNSGVIHTGAYYRPSSLKARLCAEGGERLYALCAARGIPHERCGKVIVATRPDELARLDAIGAAASANGVPAVFLDPRELGRVEPAVSGIRALHVPGAGIVDYGRVAAAFRRDIEAAGGVVATATPVTGFDDAGTRVRLMTPRGTFEADRVISCAGLYADRLARLSGADPSPQIVPFRGSYYATSRPLVRGLVYPVPDPALPFLGIHLTKRLDGSVLAGPNAVLALAREGYSWACVAPGDIWETISYRGFRRLARRHWRAALTEVINDLSRSRFTKEARRLVPSLHAHDLTRSRAGVRAQAVGMDGALLDDFHVARVDAIVHVRNAPSPAASSSLALARHIVETYVT